MYSAWDRPLAWVCKDWSLKKEKNCLFSSVIGQQWGLQLQSALKRVQKWVFLVLTIGHIIKERIVLWVTGDYRPGTIDRCCSFKHPSTNHGSCTMNRQTSSFTSASSISKRVSGRTNQMFGEVKDNTAGIKITVSICQARQFQNTIDGSYILNTPLFEYIHNENSSHDSLCWSQSRPDRSWWDLHTDGTHSDTQSNK